MENNNINAAAGKPCSSSDVKVNLSEEKSLPSGETWKNPEKVGLNVNTKLKVATSSAQDTPRQVEIESIIPDEDEDVITLSAISADEEAFEDLIEECPETEESELPSKIEHKLETYFSDIESSDNSQEYEPVFEMKSILKTGKVNEKVDLVVGRDAVISRDSTENVGVESCKTEIELELEPVESDEEDFEDLLTLKKAPVLGHIDEKLSDVSIHCGTGVEAVAALPQETDEGDVIQSAAVGEEPTPAPKKLEEADGKDVVEIILENLVEPAKDKGPSDEEPVSNTSPASHTVKADTLLDVEDDSNSARDNNKVLEDLQDRQEKENDDKVPAGLSSVQDNNSLIDEEESVECIQDEIVDCVEEEIVAEEDSDDPTLLDEDQIGEKETQNEVESGDDVEVLVILKEDAMDDSELEEENPEILGKEQKTDVIEAAIDDESQPEAANESIEIIEEDRESTAPKDSTESDKETLESKEDSPVTNSVDDQPTKESPEEEEAIESKNESEISIANGKATKRPDSEKSTEEEETIESKNESEISIADDKASKRPDSEKSTEEEETIESKNESEISIADGKATKRPDGEKSTEEEETIESKNESEISIANGKATKRPDSEKLEQQIDGEVDQIPMKSVESVEETSISSVVVQISSKDEEDTKPAETVEQVIEPQPSPIPDDPPLEKVEETMEAIVAPAKSPSLESSTEKTAENETKETATAVEETKQSDLPIDDVLTVPKTPEEKIEDKSVSNSEPPAPMTIDTKDTDTQQEPERRQSIEQKVDESISPVQSPTQPPEESISETPPKSPHTQKVESSDQEEPSKPVQSEEPPQMEDNELEMESPPSPKDIEMLDTAASSEESISTKEQPTIEKDMPNEKDDEEPLLMIDTSHKEENDQEDNAMDTETEQTATSTHSTDSSSEGSLEVFYDKECIHYECKHGSKNFFRATLFTLNYYKISKKRNKAQFVCEDCYDRALGCYEDFCKALKQKQPLLRGTTFKGQEFVEIIDSSDEEDTDAGAEKYKDENALPKESIELLEAELEGAIRKVMNNVEIQNQLSWTKQILQQRLHMLEEDTEYVSVHLKQLQKKADNMHNSLYQCPKIKIRQLTPLDLNSGRTYNPENETSIPPMGEILRQSIRVNETYYAVKTKAIASWVTCKVIEEIDGYLPSQKNLKHFKIKFLKSKYPMLKTVSAKHMAFFNPPKVRLPIGTRVIAYFDATSLSRGKEKMLIPSAFYPGIIAEPLKQSNKFRYLVFYDDGYFQYVYHKDVRLVCHSSENVWEDVHHQSRDFIHNYLTQYAVNRPMVQTQKGQSMLVDYNGKWIYARVIDVDCSLVQMLFEGHSRSEWIYRGSTRLGPVYKESNNLVQKGGAVSRLSRRTEPFIRYSNGDENVSQNTQDAQQQQGKASEVRSVAKKSVSRSDSQSSQPTPTVRHLNNSTIFVDDDNKPKGKVVYYTARKNMPPRNYFSHICSPSCPFTVTHNLSLYSPLAKPLLSGWERQVLRQKSKKFIIYRGPCGKRMRNMDELHKYLRITRNELNVDNFDFSPETNCLAEYVIESCIVQKKDISNGKEKMPIPCVNYYDNTMPPECIYSSRRIPTEGVPLNLDKGFLVGCDCKDDCSDKANCSCWQLTYAGAKYGMPNVPNEMVGYQYKRLYEHVPTGIYECNSRCKCKANCVNRVVQQPLQSKLQVFKTSNRGWGLRCINDVPRGSFICVYAGHLLTEQKANEGGLDAGDEYFAELDYIEVAEQIKEGYESDVPDYEEDEDLYNPDKDDDDDEFIAPGDSRPNRAIDTRLRTRRSTKDAEHDSQERQVISFEPNKTMGQPDNSASEKPTIRKLFGKDEACYVMDAKVTGNLGRYFNHSCSPNLFVQNVFVDTHDLRFPWVAFFAFTHIRAGTELTWNYNYEVGVVPGKVLYCQCGAPNCRQRLL